MKLANKLRMPLRSSRLGLAAVTAGTFALSGGAAPTTTAAHFLGYAPVSVTGFAPNASPWGGYVATGSGFRSIVGSWVEPAVTCTSSNNLFAPWVGIDGYGSSTVEQTGAEVSCASGGPVYKAWYEMYPAPPVYLSTATYPVQANDSFTGSVTTTGNGSYKLVLKNNTRGWTYSTTKRLRGQNVSAEAIIESPTQSYPRFTATTYSNITVNGQVFNAYNPMPLSSGGYNPTPLVNGGFSLR